jgi:hypothetical protein
MRRLQVEVDGQAQYGQGWSYSVGEVTGDGVHQLRSGTLHVDVPPGPMHITLCASCDEDDQWSIEWREEGATPLRWGDVLEIVDAAARTLARDPLRAWIHAGVAGEAPGGTLSQVCWHVVC